VAIASHVWDRPLSNHESRGLEAAWSTARRVMGIGVQDLRPRLPIDSHHDNQLNNARESREPQANGVKPSSVLVITSPHQTDEFHPTNFVPS
jgi:hypothetical protein